MSQFIKTVFLFFVISSCSKEISETTSVETEEPEVIEGSTLPLIRINTRGNPIVDEPKIAGSFDILEDDVVIEAHQIGIEIRGSSSQMFDKKSYGFETWDENGEDLNVELAGFPEEEDWILYGPYSDKSLLRNVLIYELSNKMGQYASRTAFYELEINEVFLGTYVLMEKIKRDKNRVDISKNKEEDITGLELAMDSMNEVLAPMKSFIIPGGHQAISTAHIARCVCRRAERWCVNMQEEDLFVETLVIKYLNRLSDYLFTLARYIGHLNGVADLPWKPRI